MLDDFKEVCRKINIPQADLPHENKGPMANYRENYDEDSKNIIEQVYKEEIQRFGYSF